MKPPPWKLPASDPMEGPFAEACERMRRQLGVGQHWATGERCAFEITRLGAYDAFGIIRSYDDSGTLRWERQCSFWFGYFAGLLVGQDRRPVRWYPNETEHDSTDPTKARARVLETD